MCEEFDICAGRAVKAVASPNTTEISTRHVEILEYVVYIQFTA